MILSEWEMNFSKSFAVVATAIAMLSTFSGAYIHADAVNEGEPGGTMVKKIRIRENIDTQQLMIQVSPALVAALFAEAQRLAQRQIPNAVLVITPHGELQFIGTLEKQDPSKLIGPEQDLRLQPILDGNGHGRTLTPQPILDGNGHGRGLTPQMRYEDDGQEKNPNPPTKMLDDPGHGRTTDPGSPFNL
jgi:hypothetical protein